MTLIDLPIFGMRCYFYCCFVNYINPLWIIFHGLSYLIPLLFSVVFFWCFVNPGGVLKPTENRSSLSLRRLLLLKFFLESLFREIFFSLLQKITLSFFPRLGDGFSFERDKFKINEFWRNRINPTKWFQISYICDLKVWAVIVHLPFACQNICFFSKLTDLIFKYIKFVYLITIPFD